VASQWKDGHDPIHIRESRRGAFTAAALSHHEGVQEFAHHVIADPGDYSGHLRKEAQFAVNSREWHH